MPQRSGPTSCSSAAAAPSAEISPLPRSSTRTETVRDTVREQEVEVEDDRTDRGAGVTTGTGRVTTTPDRTGR